MSLNSHNKQKAQCFTLSSHFRQLFCFDRLIGSNASTSMSIISSIHRVTHIRTLNSIYHSSFNIDKYFVYLFLFSFLSSLLLIFFFYIFFFCSAYFLDTALIQNGIPLHELWCHRSI